MRSDLGFEGGGVVRLRIVTSAVTKRNVYGGLIGIPILPDPSPTYHIRCPESTRSTKGSRTPSPSQPPLPDKTGSDDANVQWIPSGDEVAFAVAGGSRAGGPSGVVESRPAPGLPGIADLIPDVPRGARRDVGRRRGGDREGVLHRTLPRRSGGGTVVATGKKDKEHRPDSLPHGTPRLGREGSGKLRT